MSDVKELLQQLLDEAEEAKKNVEEVVDKNKKIAVGRARKNLQNLKKLAQDVRVALQEFKVNM